MKIAWWWPELNTKSGILAIEMRCPLTFHNLNYFITQAIAYALTAERRSFALTLLGNYFMDKYM
jgi:hypothetical protein